MRQFLSFFLWFVLFIQQVAPKQQNSEVPQSRPGEEKIEASSEAVQSIAVRQKLKELETEIDKFRSENAALAKMRAEREEVRTSFGLLIKMPLARDLNKRKL